MAEQTSIFRRVVLRERHVVRVVTIFAVFLGCFFAFSPQYGEEFFVAIVIGNLDGVLRRSRPKDQ
jgi:hypothetical protein